MTACTAPDNLSGSCKKEESPRHYLHTMDAISTGTLESGQAATAAPAQEALYLEAVQLYGPALIRLARGYEAEPERRKDLLQEIHVALWRSCAIFDQRCSLRTWVYRVAHITATKHIMAGRRVRLREMFTLDEIPEPEDAHNDGSTHDREEALRQLLNLIQQLKPLDRQVILLYLEDFSADAIGEVVGLSAQNIATKIHRIKKLLAAMLDAGG